MLISARMKPVSEVRLENLERLVKELGTLDAVATAGGTSSVYLSQIRTKAVDRKTGRARTMGDAMARRLESGTCKPAGWMDHEHDESHENDTVQTESAPAPAPESGHFSNVGEPITLNEMRRIPVVGEVKGGDDGFFDELVYPIGHGEGYLLFPTTDPLAYGLRVRGDSMHPRYRHGEFVVVEPSFEPSPGDDVVVVCSNGRKMLKMLNWRRGDEIQLMSVNSDHRPLTVALSEIQSMQLVGGRAAQRMLRK